MLEWILLAILITLLIQTLVAGKNSWLVKIIKNFGFPGIQFALHFFFSRDSIFIKTVKGIISGLITFFTEYFVIVLAITTASRTERGILEGAGGNCGNYFEFIKL